MLSATSKPRICDYKCSLNRINNMDETPIFFDMVGALTLDYRGAQSIPIVQPEIIRIDLLVFWVHGRWNQAPTSYLYF